MSDSRSERERLKEEYKAHYRKMRDTRERYSRAKKTQNIVRALKNMDKGQMLDTFDDILYSVKHKVASVEARLDVAMENLESEQTAEELDEEVKKSTAQETLRQVKMEMGLLYDEIEKQAENLNVEKTIGSSSTDDAPESSKGGRKKSDEEVDL